MKKTLYILSLLLIISTIFTSCDKSFDNPDSKTVPVGTVLTIADVRALYVAGETVRINSDISVYGVVTADETTGNLYKESYIQDETGALYLRFLSTSGLYVGDSIQVNLNGAIILKYNQMLQIDSLHPDNNINKIKTQKFRTPEVVTIADLNADIEGYQGKLIQIDDVKFVEGGQGMTYADGTNQVDVSRFLVDLMSNQAEVRTSGYANFANDTLPAGSGSFIGIAQQYNSALQLLIRDPNELTLNGPTPFLVSKNFEDGSLTSGGWTTQIVIGTLNWAIGTIGGSYAQMSNYVAPNNNAAETWLISPAMNFSSSASPTLEFRNAYKYTGAPLQVMISTDYDGVSVPSTATWTDVSSSATWSTGNFVWANSGLISLSSFIQPSVFVAFKYTGTAVDGSTWEVDDIAITY